MGISWKNFHIKKHSEIGTTRTEWETSMMRRNQGRNQNKPKFDNVRIHISVSPAARDAIFAMAANRRMSAGLWLEELVWQESRRLREEPPRSNTRR